MKVAAWKTVIKTDWSRALMLKGLFYNTLELVLTVEEEGGKLWKIAFENIQSFKVTEEELWDTELEFPEFGGLFKVLDSEWIKELDARFISNPTHYIICCYDEVIELVADGVSITSL